MPGLPIRDGKDALEVDWLEIVIRDSNGKITYDFHPECLIAARARPSVLLTLVYRLTLFWRRRVDLFEVLGDDQRKRIEQIGVSGKRIRIKATPKNS